MKLAACIEYDGSKFHGWQIQPGTKTVQAEMEKALSQVADHNVRVVTAGRTDSGVHACAQIVHFETHSYRSQRGWVRGANTLLPAGVALHWVSPVPDDFHARFKATGRHYRYVMLNRSVHPTFLDKKVTWDHRKLNVELMREAAIRLVGRHDFSAFRSSRCQAKTAVRDLRKLDVKDSGEWIWFDVEANAFLHHMVRNLCGVLLTIGAGDEKPDWAAQVLQSRDRTQGGITAPADGLYLVKVDYPEHYCLPNTPEACRFW